MNKRYYLYILLLITCGILLIISITSLPKKQTPSLPRVGQKAIPTVYENMNAAQTGKKSYAVSSPLITRTNTLVTDNSNTILFKRTIFLSSNVTLPRFGEYTKKYGQPEKEVVGSKYYGSTMVTKIYARQGVTLIGNPNTQEVYELQEYTSMSVEEYISTYGDDIDQNKNTHEAL